MARRLGVSNQRWSNVTRGLPLGMDLTRRLVTRFPGLTTDWLWFGRTDGMSVEMAEALRLADGALALWDHENRTLTRATRP
jgi:hypothetical protein